MSALTPTPSRLLLWLPLALLLTALGWSVASGSSPLPTAHAASSINITGSVDSDLQMDLSGCLPAAVDIGDILPGTDPWKTAQDNGGGTCAVAFGSANHGAGTTLSLMEDPAAPAAPADAMKCVGGGCSGDSLADFTGGAEPAPGTSAFGTQLLGSGGVAAPIWSAAPAVQALGDAASPACSTSAAGIGTCTFTWGATAATSDTPGAYQALARMLVIAN